MEAEASAEHLLSNKTKNVEITAWGRNYDYKVGNTQAISDKSLHITNA